MLNKVELIGNLGKDPILRHTSGGTAVVNLSVATHFVAKDKTKTTTWHNVVAFGKTAEFAAANLKKGALVRVEGRMNYRAFENKDKVKVNVAEVITDRLQALSAKKVDELKTEVESAQASAEPMPPNVDKTIDKNLEDLAAATFGSPE